METTKASMLVKREAKGWICWHSIKMVTGQGFIEPGRDIWLDGHEIFLGEEWQFSQ